MSGAKPPRHGRDHRPGGFDPIPFPQTAVLDWCHVEGHDGTPPIAASHTFAGGKIAYADSGSIPASTSSTAFSIVTASLTDDNGTSSKNVLRVPADQYLITVTAAVSGQLPAVNPVAYPWTCQVAWQQAGGSWTTDPDLWFDSFRDPTQASNTLALTPVNQTLVQTIPVTVPSVTGDTGFGKLTLLYTNYDDTAAHEMFGQFFVVRMTLGATTDSLHS